jgi:hypothetical protein
MQDVKKCRRPKVTATCEAPLGRQGARSLASIEHGHLLRGSDDAKQSATTLVPSGATDTFAGTIERLESGKPGDKRVRSALATALGVPFCRLVCDDHSCADRACVHVVALGP